MISKLAWQGEGEVDKRGERKDKEKRRVVEWREKRREEKGEHREKAERGRVG